MNICCKDLCKSYKEVVLDHYNVEFIENEVNVIMGKSGCGKSTLLKILLGLEKQDGGVVLGLEDKKIACVFQQNNLCKNLTVLANIKLVNDSLCNEDVIKALEEVGLRGKQDYYIKECSGGMKRRVAIVRALMSEFDVLIMDEPFKGLDVCTKEKVIGFMKTKIQSKTVIVVTHDKHELSYFKDCNIVCMD